ncbi:hypothetical protein DMENIID0001_135600 [Sergentomyia squamirostris]
MSSDSLNSDLTNFTTIDYVSFVLVLGISVGIGLYFAIWFKGRENTPEDYFLGGRDMGVIPVAVSLSVTFISGILIIGFTTVVYQFGTYPWLDCFTFLIMTLCVVFLFLPIFYEVKLPSTFGYIRLRFGRKAQLMASFISIVTATLYVSVNLYIPALVLNFTLGTSILTGTLVLGSCCIFYTTFGGFRAVIWADFFQACLIVLCNVAIVYIGLKLVGGFEEVWDASERGGRIIIFDFDPDPTIRFSTLNFLFGSTFVVTQQFGLNQSSIQRYLSTSSIKKARCVAVIFYVNISVVMLLCVLTGLIIYAYYENCDPVSSGIVREPDQIVPLFVMEMAHHLSGLSGIFVAGIVAGCLSTMSSCLNSSTVCLYEDFLRPYLPEMSNQKTCNLLKMVTVVLGCLQIILVFVIMKIGSIITILLTLMGLTNGSMLGLFTMGMLVPKANQTGAIAGTVTSIVCVAVVLYGGLYKKPDPTLPVNTEGCHHNFTSLLNHSNFEEPDDLPLIFRISFMYYGTMGFVIAYLVGVPVSLLTGGNTITDQRLLAPFLRRKNQEVPGTNIPERIDLFSGYSNLDINASSRT